MNGLSPLEPQHQNHTPQASFSEAKRRGRQRGRRPRSQATQPCQQHQRPPQRATQAAAAAQPAALPSQACGRCVGSGTAPERRSLSLGSLLCLGLFENPQPAREEWGEKEKERAGGRKGERSRTPIRADQGTSQLPRSLQLRLSNSLGWQNTKDNMSTKCR